MNDYCLLIVIYNQDFSKSAIFNIIKYCKTLQVFFFDNSTNTEIALINQKNLQRDNFHYYKSKNIGLSKAYNYLLNIILKIHFNWVVILDQDTFIDNSFLDLVHETVNKNHFNGIYIPKVCYKIKDKTFTLSPKKSFFSGSNFLIGKNKSNLIAINSGMLINTNVYRAIGLYNEELFLDFIDQEFLRRYRKKFPYIYLYNSQLIQEFSGVQYNSIKNSLDRFTIFLKDSKFYYSQSFFHKLYRLIRIIFRSLKFSFIYKNFIFIKVLRGNLW